MPRIQSQKKLREMRLRKGDYLQNTEKRPREYSWRLRGRAILRSKGKCTRVLLQEFDKVLDRRRWVSQGSMSKPATVC